MAIQLKICVVPSDDCGKLYFFEKTGDYDSAINPGGYGTPNPQIVNVNTSNIDLLYPGATIPVSYNPYTGNPGSGLPTNNPDSAYLLEPSMFDLDSFSSGVYTITYSIGGIFSGTPFTVNASTSFVLDCDLRCCIKKKNHDAALKVVNGNCSCSSENTITTMFLDVVLEAAEAAACCGNVTEAKKLFDYVKSKCSGCGCGGN